MRNIWLALATLLCCTSAAQETLQFPKSIKYKMSKDGRVLGDCLLFYSRNTQYPHSSSVSLRNFKGFGFSSNDKLYTYFNKKTLALYDALLQQGDTVVYEILHKKGGIMGEDTTTYMFKENRPGTSGKAQGTELYSKNTAIDLLSSYFVASAKVAQGAFSKPINFDMFFEKRVRPVTMEPKGSMQLEQDGKKVEVQIVRILLGKEELYRFLIATDEAGYTYPMRVIIESEDQGSLELIASKVVYP